MIKMRFFKKRNEDQKNMSKIRVTDRSDEIVSGIEEELDKVKCELDLLYTETLKGL